MRKRHLIWPLMFVLLFCIFSGSVFAEDPGAGSGAFDTTEALIQLLKEKGVLSEEEAEKFIQRHQQKAKETDQVITIIPEEREEKYLKEVTREVTEKVTEDLKDLRKDHDYMSDELLRRDRVQGQRIDELEREVKEEHAQKLFKSSWAQRIRFGGDIRLRHESAFFDPENTAVFRDPVERTKLINTRTDRHRQRIRVRFGIKAKLIDPREVNVGKVDAEVRLATGHVDNPVSTNATLGDNTDSKTDVVLDRAYLKWSWQPELAWAGKYFPEFALTGGIMPNPWFFTDLVWDKDLSFEGFVFSHWTDTLQSNSLKGFLTLGVFPLQELQWSQEDKYLLGGQVGFNHRPAYGWEYTLGAAYYDYQNITGELVSDATTNPASARALNEMRPKYWQKGNSYVDMNLQSTGFNDQVMALATEYKLVNLTGKLDNTLFFPIHVIFQADYVKNIGYDSQDIADKSFQSKAFIDQVTGSEGYKVALKVGYPKPRDFGNWNLSMAYKYLESDAVLDAFTDSDFALGGTNAKGWIFGGEMGLYRNIWLRARWLSSNNITDFVLDGDPYDFGVDVLQIDLNAEY